MIKLIIGKKGAGKTKRLVEMVNSAAETSLGNVVCIEKGVGLRFDIKPTVRLINTNEYLVFDAEALYGFVAGILASNHDVTDLFIDGTLRICANDIAALEKLVEEIDILTVKREVNVVMTASIAEEDASAIVKKYI